MNMTIDTEQVEAQITARLEALDETIAKAQAEKVEIQAELELLQKLATKYSSPSKAKKAAPKGKKIAAKGRANKKVTKKAAKKAAPKAKVTKGKAVSDASRKNAEAGRAAVARGDRPSLKEAIKKVMGKKTMNASQIVQALAEKKWLPASADPRQYVSYMLSSKTPEVFERTAKRGFYRVRTSAAPAKAAKSGNGKKKVAKKKAVKKAKATPKAVKSDPKVDAKLSDLTGIDTSNGPNVASDPHAEAGATA